MMLVVCVKAMQASKNNALGWMILHFSYKTANWLEFTPLYNVISEHQRPLSTLKLLLILNM